MKILVTGSAGFIGLALCIRLLERGDVVLGIDNHNNHYNPVLKEARLARHESHPNYTHKKIDIMNRTTMENIFKKYKPKYVVNLAAQAGDVPDTWANVDDLIKDFDYQPKVEIDEGIENFVNWFKDYYKL